MFGVSFVVLFFVVAPLRPQGQARPFDIVIINGHIIDGTGSPWLFRRYRHSWRQVSTPSAISAPRPALATVDAGGKVVAPRLHRHARSVGEHHPCRSTLPSKIYQGITTEITGEGESIAPLNDSILSRPIRSTTTNIIFSRLADPSPIFFPHREARHGNQSASYVGATRVRRIGARRQ